MSVNLTISEDGCLADFVCTEHSLSAQISDPQMMSLGTEIGEKTIHIFVRALSQEWYGCGK